MNPDEIMDRRQRLLDYYRTVTEHPLAWKETKEYSGDRLEALDRDLERETRFPIGSIVEVLSSLEGYGWLPGWIVLEEFEGKVIVGHAQGIPGRLQRGFSQVRLPLKTYQRSKSGTAH